MIQPTSESRPKDALARVLDGLNNAEAPVGMEDRILKALAQADQAPSDSQRLGPKRIPWLGTRSLANFVPPQLAYSLAASAVFAFALGVWLAHHRASSVHPTLPTSAQSGAPAASSPQPLITADAGAAYDPSPRRTHLKRPGTIQTAAPPASSGSAFESFPAPEAPLTAQERLLLRMIHQGDPQELAALNPAHRAALDAEDDAEFEQFFQPKFTGDPNEPAQP